MRNTMIEIPKRVGIAYRRRRTTYFHTRSETSSTAWGGVFQTAPDHLSLRG
jgi:hypothetical protein